MKNKFNFIDFVIGNVCRNKIDFVHIMEGVRSVLRHLLDLW